jgi:hypothetical protein
MANRNSWAASAAARVKTAEARFHEVVPRLHPNLDLTGFVWPGALTKFEAKCKLHGSFMTQPSYLTGGCGCPRCGLEKNCENRRAKLADVLEKFKKVHGDRYDYSKVVETKNNKTKVIVGCADHGDFEILVTSHTKGKGCRKCGKIASMKTRGIHYQTIGFDGRVFLTPSEIETYRRRLPARLQIRDFPKTQHCAVCGGEEAPGNKLTMAHRIPYGAGILLYGLTPDWLDQHSNLCWAHIKKCNAAAEYSDSQIRDIIEELRRQNRK